MRNVSHTIGLNSNLNPVIKVSFEYGGNLYMQSLSVLRLTSWRNLFNTDMNKDLNKLGRLLCLGNEVEI